MNKEIKLGLKENIYQFTLLAIVNAFVGAMIGFAGVLTFISGVIVVFRMRETLKSKFQENKL